MIKEKRNIRRKELSLIFAILLIGALCMLASGTRAIQLDPFWSLNADMRSNLNPDSIQVLDQEIQPVLPDIMTRPAWMDTFLTPMTATPGIAPTQMVGTAEIQMTLVALTNVQMTNAQMTGISKTGVAGTQNANTQIANAQNTAISAAQTATAMPPTLLPPPWKPPQNPPQEEPPLPTPTATNTPTGTLDLGIDLSPLPADNPNSTDYYGTTFVYTVTVTNYGPDDAVDARVWGDLPTPQPTSWTWTCSSQTNASGCNGGSAASFEDFVNINVGGEIVYKVALTIPPSAMGVLNSLVNVDAPIGKTDPPGGNNNFAGDGLDGPYVDLSLTIIDGGTIPLGGTTTYTPGGTVYYEITITNNGPMNAVGLTNVYASYSIALIVNAWFWKDGICGGVDDEKPSPYSFDLTNLMVGDTIQFCARADILPLASDDLIASFQVSPPIGYTELDFAVDNVVIDTNVASP